MNLSASSRNIVLNFGTLIYSGEKHFLQKKNCFQIWKLYFLLLYKLFSKKHNKIGANQNFTQKKYISVHKKKTNDKRRIYNSYVFCDTISINT